MAKIWMIGSTLRGLQIFENATIPEPPTWQLLNRGPLLAEADQVKQTYPEHEWWEVNTLMFATMPMPVLRITAPGFDLDFMRYSIFDFVSARARAAFALGDDVIRYRATDTTQSTPDVQRQEYCAFAPVQFGNPYDPDRMPGDVRDVRQPDGTLKREWVLDWFGKYASRPSEVFLRDDFVPPAPLFRAAGSTTIFATDDFAEQVMRAGIDDIAFTDVTGAFDDPRDRLRHLR